MIVAKARRLEDTTNVIAEANANLERMEHCVEKNLFPLKTDSLLMKKVIEKEWKPLWNIVPYVEQIMRWKDSHNVII